MQALPFAQYTHREGVLNLAKYFPRQYVPPDLGPKMYNAYGRHAAWRGMDPSVKKGGHTNLHCDVSDAVNVMVDVGLDDDDDDSDDEGKTRATSPRVRSSMTRCRMARCRTAQRRMAQRRMALPTPLHHWNGRPLYLTSSSCP